MAAAGVGGGAAALALAADVGWDVFFGGEGATLGVEATGAAEGGVVAAGAG